MKHCILILMAIAASQAAPIKVMLLDGQSGGTYHDWKATTPVMKQQLESTGLFEVEVVTAPPSGGDFTQFKPDFKKYQVVVSNLDSPEWPAQLMTAFEEYMKLGGGLVVVHAADNAFPKWPAYNLMIGVGGWRGRTADAGPMWYMKDGKLTSDPTPGNAGSHGNRLPYAITNQEPNHPILRGLPKVWMHAPDELYATLRGPGKDMHVIGTAHSLPSNKGTDRDEPILMTIEFGKGRVFHTAMGHDVAALKCAGFATTFQRGTEWAATGKVTQKVPADFPTADKVSLR